MSGTQQQFPMLCRHCGNRTPHDVKFSQDTTRLYDIVEDEEGEREWVERYDSFVVACGTCRSLSLLGGFQMEQGRANPQPQHYPVLYPAGPDIVPPAHTLMPNAPVPEKVLTVYSEAWPLRHTAPSAFANQIRRALEYVCQDRGAVGKTLYDQLRDLAKRSVFPPQLAEMADLVREVGNRGSHASLDEVNIWDAELLDQLFRLILQYVYIGPAHVERLRNRLKGTH